MCEIDFSQTNCAEFEKYKFCENFYEYCRRNTTVLKIKQPLYEYYSYENKTSTLRLLDENINEDDHQSLQCTSVPITCLSQCSQFAACFVVENCMLTNTCYKLSNELYKMYYEECKNKPSVCDQACLGYKQCFTCTEICDSNCFYNSDGDCDDGGIGSHFSECPEGSDCEDCGERISHNCSIQLAQQPSYSVPIAPPISPPSSPSPSPSFIEPKPPFIYLPPPSSNIPNAPLFPPPPPTFPPPLFPPPLVPPSGSHINAFGGTLLILLFVSSIVMLTRVTYVLFLRRQHISPIVNPLSVSLSENLPSSATAVSNAL